MKIVAILILIISCGSKKQEKIEKNGKTNNSEQEEYYGHWVSECKKIDYRNFHFNWYIEFEKNGYYQYKASINKEKLVRSALISNVSNCNNPIKIYRSEEKFTKINKMENKKRFTIDFTIASIKKSYNNDQLISKANKSKFYGYTDWKVGEYKEVSGLKKTDDSFTEPRKGSLWFDLMALDGGNLRFGKYITNEKEGRTTELDDELYYRVEN